MNKKDFLKLFLPEKDKWFRYAFWSLKDKDEAKDIVQETFIRLWNLRDRLNRYQSPEALALRILKNLCIDHYRKMQANLTVEDLAVTHDISNQVNVQEQLEYIETSEVMTKLISTLPENQRMILLLKQVEGLKPVEIAEQMGMNVNTVEVNLSRARKKIRKAFNSWKQDGR